MADPNRALFESVVHPLAPVLDELVFVGGCTTGVFITDPIVAICHRWRERQAIPILELPLPDPLPSGWEWIEAYRRWAKGRW